MTSTVTTDLFGYVDPRNEWETPGHLFRELDRIFRFGHDMAANSRNHKCESWYGPDHPMKGRRDALSVRWPVSWPSGEWLWCNPPFSQLWLWCEKAAKEWRDRDATSALLMPANRCDTFGFHSYVLPAATIVMLRGRTKFLPAPGITASSPAFGCLLAVYGGLPEGFPLDHPLFGLPMMARIDGRRRL